MKSRTYTTRCLCTIAALVLLLATNIAKAQLVMCDADSRYPQNQCAATGAITAGASTVPIVWRGYAMVERNSILTSSGASFSATNRTTLGAIKTPLQTNLLANATGTAVLFTLNETLTLPTDIISQANGLGAREIVYTRRFSFEGLTTTASVTINLSAPGYNRNLSLAEGSEPGQSALGINNIHLQFSTGSQAEVISANTRLQVLATLNFDRAGMLDAVWEVAMPNSAGTKAAFRPLRNVRQYLAGNRQITLQSPDLPSDIAGLYRVRLRVNTPAISETLPVLGYQVNAALVQVEPQEITAVTPISGAIISDDSKFSWPAQAGTQAYQLEIFSDLDSEQPIAGLLLKNSTTTSPLSESVLTKLERNKLYYWRVIAINKEGVTVAASELRPLKLMWPQQ